MIQRSHDGYRTKRGIGNEKRELKERGDLDTEIGEGREAIKGTKKEGVYSNKEAIFIYSPEKRPTLRTVTVGGGGEDKTKPVAHVLRPCSA